MDMSVVVPRYCDFAFLKKIILQRSVKKTVQIQMEYSCEVFAKKLQIGEIRTTVGGIRL